MSQKNSIGETSRQCGVKIPTIRYYEKIGLLPAVPRTSSNRRAFDKKYVQRLSFIHHARELGFEIGAIRTLLILQDKPNQSCQAADAIACQHLTEIEKRIGRLMALKDELNIMIDSCQQGKIANCRVIEALAE
jgi:DNA-binding transcriptional MerR regulator